MLAIFASVMAGIAVFLASSLWIAVQDRNLATEKLESSHDERRRLQHMLQQHTETLDANAGDMDGMRSKISSHADEIMQLRVVNEKLKYERDVLQSKLADAQETFGLIDSLRVDAMQRLAP